MSEAFVGSSVAVLLSCFNEEVTIGKVVRDFRAALPDAIVYVYDNNSTDRTAVIIRRVEVCNLSSSVIDDSKPRK